jgi:uncharacterized repeat protein (TIGR02543 family)
MSDARTPTVRNRLAALLLVGGALALGPAASAQASGVTVTDLATGGSATTLAQSLAGGGVTVSNATFTGSTRAGGSFTGGTGNVGPATGVVLGSGFVQTKVGDTACSVGVEGPNSCHENNAGGENSSNMGLAGDANLDAIVSPDATHDATVLEFDFVPTTGTVDFSYVFSSEEYNDYVNAGVSDVFAFFVNGTNCALVPGTSDLVSVDNVNSGKNPGFFRNNVPPDAVTPAPIDTQMDGLTTVLNCHANVNAGVTNHIKLAIADVGDWIFDSAVFIQAGSLISGNLLTVNKAGTGGGTVTSNPAGINCGIDCTETYTSGTVELTATPDATSTFAGWSGACTNSSGTCTVTMDQARTVTATFTALPTNPLTVSKNGNGSGTVTSSPSGINCGATCSHSFLTTDTVTLTATPSTGSTFTGWSGEGCSGTATCIVTMSQARSVTATFTLEKRTLTVAKAGSGSGTVSSSPSGIDCGATCNADYDYGTSVTLTATPAAGSTFAGWSGDCSGTGQCVLSMTANHSATATFNTIPPTEPPSQTCDGKAATIVGTSGVDNLKGTKGADVIVSLGGNDKVNARGGNDTVCAGDGKDHVVGGPGNDNEFGEAGNDHLIGNKGNDDLDGGPGKDKCLGGAGNNTSPHCEN